MRSNVTLVATLALGAMLAIQAPCGAQIVQCNGATGGTNYKVLVDEVQMASGATNTPVLSIELIQSAIEGALEKVRQNVLKGVSSKSNVSYLNCKGRHPLADADFDPVRVRDMAANHAILELWGTLFPLGGSDYTFDIRYVMLSVASHGLPAPSGFAKTQKQMTSKPTPAQVQGYLTATRADLPIYFLVASGMQAFDDGSWDQAARLLCEARTRLKSRADQQDLMTYADQYAAKAAAETRKTPDSNGVSLLGEAQARDYCASVTTRP
jgi:hypothetical protein